VTDLDCMPVSIEDAAVSSALDQDLRELLSLCFTQPHDTMFRHRRFYKTPPARRWLLRAPDGLLVAQVACHDKIVVSSGTQIITAGLSEVCTHPDHRRKGLARLLITACEAWAASHGYGCCLLFGDPSIYGPMGYIPCPELLSQVGDPDAPQRVPTQGGQIKFLGGNEHPSCNGLILIGEGF